MNISTLRVSLLLSFSYCVFLGLSHAQGLTESQKGNESLWEILSHAFRRPDIVVQILAGSAVITALINLISFIMSGILRRLQHWWSAKSTVCAVTFTRGINRESYNEIQKLIDGFYCLIVRYGTDQYVSALASDQEKYEGRLKNEILPLGVTFDSSGNATLTLNLPVHRRLGTQFKCFVAAKDEESVSEVRKFLEKCDNIYEISVSKSIHSNRLYFLINRFGEAITVDNFKNNMLLPE